MNIRQLEYLVETARYCSYEKAATSLFVTPQAIAKSLKNLENEIGISLIIREGRAVKPTPFALALIDRATPILQDFADLERFADSASDSHVPLHVRLGVATARHRAIFFSQNDFERFKLANPSIKLSVSTHPNETCFAAFDEGVFDAAIVVGERTGETTCTRCIAKFDAHIMMAANHPLASSSCLTLREVGNYPIAEPIDFLRVRIAIASRFETIGINPKFVDIEPSLESLRAFLAKKGVVFVKANTSLPKFDIDAIELPFTQDDRIEFPLNLICSESASPRLLMPLTNYLKIVWSHKAQS